MLWNEAVRDVFGTIRLLTQVFIVVTISLLHSAPRWDAAIVLSSHAVGDQVCQPVAKRISITLRKPIRRFHCCERIIKWQFMLARGREVRRAVIEFREISGWLENYPHESLDSDGVFPGQVCSQRVIVKRRRLKRHLPQVTVSC